MQVGSEGQPGRNSLKKDKDGFRTNYKVSVQRDRAKLVRNRNAMLLWFIYRTSGCTVPKIALHAKKTYEQTMRKIQFRVVCHLTHCGKN